VAAAWQATGTLLGALTTSDVTPVIPAHAAGDILICQTANRVITNTCATPSGWTLLDGPTDQGTIWRSYTFWKRATSGAETNPLCDWTATSADKYGIVHTIRGALSTATPFAAQAFTVGTATSAVATGVTTTDVNQLVIATGLNGDNLHTSITSVSGTDPASYTQRGFGTITTGADAGMLLFSAVRATAGATGNVTTVYQAAPLTWYHMVAAIIDEPPPVFADLIVARYGR